MNKADLVQDIKKLIISSLDLEDLTADDIDENAPLFGDGLGLDSIDALELGMALKKKFDITFKTDKEANKKYFYSVSTLADYILEIKK
ncbi:MAG: acyl carrier protein [Alphaproteobacteria bacterium]|nr:acyl carrier protein [Alphaproteobacteria bacterium]